VIQKWSVVPGSRGWHHTSYQVTTTTTHPNHDNHDTNPRLLRRGYDTIYDYDIHDDHDKPTTPRQSKQ
jgi:hypothetical protein